MILFKRVTTIFLLGIITLPTFGCATYTTISNAQTGTAKIFSGTRLDIRAIKGNTGKTKQFIVAPPKYPTVDLPLSLVADTIIFPQTFGATIFEALTE